MNTKASCGFTLIELLVTLAIVAVLALFTVPVAEVAVQRGTESELRRALREIRDALDAYKKASDEGRIQRSLQSSGYPKSLDALVDGVEDIKDPKRTKIYFLRRIPRNPLDDRPEKPAADTWAKRAYASEPGDPQEGDDVFDVYVSAPGTGLNGVPYKQW
ncbi:type II secretion system protein [Paucibacter sp. O1-1]|uniref:type II secretion system protein n=1 Tax=Paucibacter sp. XJ19-41 TaxID=2927824 RepID=UPI0021D4AEDB|nr:type II secretion system protein [Paucibacter sp. XJ19-41]MCU7376097.1 type II secretion system GspH family protein [Paucibacter sp. O1-1]MDA3831109.1 type II secretion system protein [Paucibacter sp. O1-1]MDC6171223.1 type II secretion system protein [Paucibacter sp. XJ19-41]